MADETAVHKDWYSRGYLPHFDQPDVVQSITFRLWDSLPEHVAAGLAEDRDSADDAATWGIVETFLDAGTGSCFLRDPRVAALVEDCLLYFDGKRYQLLAWVIMPNHVHVSIELFRGHPLRKVVHSWKSFSAHEANKILNRRGRFWYPDYFDRFIRSPAHFGNVVAYIHNNPVKAGLVDSAELWRYSSARMWAGR